MQPMVRVTVVTPAEFWRHGYRIGWSDGAAGRPSMLDEPPGDGLADVIPLWRDDDALAGDQLAELPHGIDGHSG